MKDEKGEKVVVGWGEEIQGLGFEDGKIIVWLTPSDWCKELKKGQYDDLRLPTQDSFSILYSRAYENGSNENDLLESCKAFKEEFPDFPFKKYNFVTDRRIEHNKKTAENDKIKLKAQYVGQILLESLDSTLKLIEDANENNDVAAEKITKASDYNEKGDSKQYAENLNKFFYNHDMIKIALEQAQNKIRTTTSHLKELQGIPVTIDNTLGDSQ